MTVRLRAIILLAILAAACCAPLAAQTYTFASVQCNNAAISAYGMNGSGVIAGTAGQGGAIYYNGKCQAFPSVFFYNVSDTDWLIGGITGSNLYYLIEPGPKGLPLPNYPGAQATSYCCIDSASGTLAGNYIPTHAPLTARSGFFYQNGKFTSLPWGSTTGSVYWYTLAALNNTGTAVGTYYGN